MCDGIAIRRIDMSKRVTLNRFVAEDPNNPYAIMGLGCAVTNSPSLPAMI